MPFCNMLQEIRFRQLLVSLFKNASIYERMKIIKIIRLIKEIINNLIIYRKKGSSRVD